MADFVSEQINKRQRKSAQKGKREWKLVKRLFTYKKLGIVQISTSLVPLFVTYINGRLITFNSNMYHKATNWWLGVPLLCCGVLSLLYNKYEKAFWTWIWWVFGTVSVLGIGATLSINPSYAYYLGTIGYCTEQSNDRAVFCSCFIGPGSLDTMYMSEGSQAMCEGALYWVILALTLNTLCAVVSLIAVLGQWSKRMGEVVLRLQEEKSWKGMPKFEKTLFNDFRLVGDAEDEAARKANPIIDIPLVGGLANPLFETIDELAAASDHTQGVSEAGSDESFDSLPSEMDNFQQMKVLRRALRVIDSEKEGTEDEYNAVRNAIKRCRERVSESNKKTAAWNAKKDLRKGLGKGVAVADKEIKSGQKGLSKLSKATVVKNKSHEDPPGPSNV